MSDLPEASTISLLLGHLADASASALRYRRHAGVGAYEEGRASGLKSAVFFVTNIDHYAIDHLVERFVESGRPTNAAEIEQLLTEARAIPPIERQAPGILPL